MLFSKFLHIALTLPLLAATPPRVLIAQSELSTPDRTGPVDLRVDGLPAPLGIDDPAPRFSWQLRDPAPGARQTACEILVASSAGLLDEGKPDIWDSGRITSGISLNVLYDGKRLSPSTRYFWQVKVWNAAGEPYARSQTAWWETGVLTEDSWRAQWIGYETAEEAAVRQAPAQWIASPDFKALGADKSSEQHFAYRQSITLSKPVRTATLYATGQDTVSAWINGAQILTANPLPPYKQMPWMKFVRADATGKLAQGANSLAIEVVHYGANPNGQIEDDAPPMISTLVVEYADGTTASFSTGTDWKSAVHAVAGWQQKDFDDSSWKGVIAWRQQAGPAIHPWIPDSVKTLGRNFVTQQPAGTPSIRSVRLYATALGAYEFFINGDRVGDQVLAPGWTDYREHVKYQTYDVTSLVRNGSNAIWAQLAPGWYETPLEWFQQPNNYGVTPPALKAQLRIEYSDGSMQWVSTDTSWLAHRSYILHSEIYDGESQDLEHAPALWVADNFDRSQWNKAIAIEPRPVMIEAQDFQPIRVERTLSAKSMTEPKPRIYVYDFGQNFSGLERLRVSGPAGTKVTVRFAEIVNADGTIYTDNLRTAKATDTFVLKGAGPEELTPHFTFHGFRYLEVTGLSAPLPTDAVTALVIHTAAPFTTKLSTGSPMINQLWSNIQWGQRSNFVGLPTDCPQRDERLGWMADAQVFWRAASYNMALAPFSRKFAEDMRGTQVGSPYYGIYSPGTSRPNMGSGAGWSDAGVIIPWTSWLQTGDTTIINQNWAAMEKYLDAIDAHNPDGLWTNQSGTPFGDWLSPEGKTDNTLIATAYWAYDVTLMRQMALATSRTEDAQKYAQLFEKIRDAFDKQFVHDDGFISGADNTPSPFGQINNPNAKSNGGDTQTSYVLALHMNLLPDNLRGAAAKKLADKIKANHDLLGTGFLGTPYLLEELTNAGYADLAYTLLLNTRYPSWGYMVTHGATTTWERWNGDQMKADPSMNSYNHYAYGAVADWIYRYAAGVDATSLDAGFHTVFLHPVFNAQLGNVSLDYDSVYGPIHSAWTVKGSTAEWQLTLPANTTGRLNLTDDEARKYSLNGQPISQTKLARSTTEDGKQSFELPSGAYTFVVGL